MTTPNCCGNCGAPLPLGAVACPYCLVAFAGGAGAGTPTAVVTMSAALDTQIVELLRSGNKIGAIKLYRERHNVGLLEAKQAIDALDRELGRR